ncbi:DUF4097 domain-containing protein [Hymenobacter sp. RP-2-7]|uniref:DUF4097 domain-containing protein n=1 Tax=Hymenobacter polaris TaxID=2682546 RepID=A0A7Y0AC25_9BACT|nr:DUF4097 family beta strand repeat-containing protein [Hymenobacter polaris]NML64597.1 DUF4097 domain-containing protein [Hymenobacter polaris]
MTRFLLAAGLLLAALAPARAQRLVTQTAALGPGQRVTLRLKFGRHIRVRPGSGPGLLVRAQVRINDNQLNDAYRLDLDQTGDEVRVVEKLDEDKLRDSNFRGPCDGSTNNGSRDGHRYSYCALIDYDVTLPAGTALSVSTISGDVDVASLSGEVAAESVSGNLALRQLAGPVRARSTSGNVELAQLSGPVTARSVSGDVTLGQLASQSVQASSVSGDVKASWPAGRAATLTLKSTSGEVYTDPAVTFSNLRPDSRVGYELHGSYGTGPGPQVQLQSVSGNVFFRPVK